MSSKGKTVMIQKVQFTKMQAMGNDFVVLDLRRQKVVITRSLCQFLAHRHYGVGCDQILVIDQKARNASYFVRIFNADGSEVGQCGNGMRCVVRYLLDHGHTEPTVKLQTITATMQGWSRPSGEISVEMGNFTPHNVQPLMCYWNDQAIQGYFVDIGNPHWVYRVSDVACVDMHALEELKKENSQYFPHGVNIECIQIDNDQEISIRILERGVGETMACGSGACASAMVSHFLSKTKSPCVVKMRGGRVQVCWDMHQQQTLVLTGPVRYVFQGSLLK